MVETESKPLYRFDTGYEKVYK